MSSVSLDPSVLCLQTVYTPEFTVQERRKGPQSSRHGVRSLRLELRPFEKQKQSQKCCYKTEMDNIEPSPDVKTVISACGRPQPLPGSFSMQNDFGSSASCCDVYREDPLKLWSFVRRCLMPWRMPLRAWLASVKLSQRLEIIVFDDIWAFLDLRSGFDVLWKAISGYKWTYRTI